MIHITYMSTFVANPFASPLLAPAMTTLGVVLVIGLLVICVVEGHDPSRADQEG